MPITEKRNHHRSFLSSLFEQFTPGIYIISTPIGHFGDITLRALEVLRAMNTVYCEDTRVTKKLLDHYGISQNLRRYDDHVGHRVRPEIINKVRAGESVGLVSDAGTPLLSDPGYKLVRKAREENIPLIPVPGVSAITTGLTVSGLAPYPFCFHGFFPSAHGESTSLLKRIQQWSVTHVFFERATRVQKTLERIASLWPDCQVSICRELTKKFEQVLCGDLKTVAVQVKEHASFKGEVVLMLHVPQSEAVDDDELCLFLEKALEEMTLKSAVSEAVQTFQVERKRAYTLGLSLKESK